MEFLNKYNWNENIQPHCVVILKSKNGNETIEMYTIGVAARTFESRDLSISKRISLYITCELFK